MTGDILDRLPAPVVGTAPGWLLVEPGHPDGRVVLLEVGAVKLAPLFPAADLARQFLHFAGRDDRAAYPDRPDGDRYRRLREQAIADGSRGLLVITGVHPWHALACTGGCWWQAVPRPTAILS